MASSSSSSWQSAIPFIEGQASNQCGTGHDFSIFPKPQMNGGHEYSCVLPIGLLYHCLSVSTGEQCIRSHGAAFLQSAAASAISASTAIGAAGGRPASALGPHIEDWVTTAAYVVEVVSPTLLALGLLSNILVMSVLCHIRMRSAVNSFLLSSTIAQVLYIIAVFLLRLVDYSNEYTQHIFHREGRVYIHHLSYFFWLIVMWQLLAGAVERVVTGYSGDSARRYCSPLRADAINILIWLCAFGLVFPNLWYSHLERVSGYASATHSPLPCSVLYWFQLVFSVFLPYPLLLILTPMLISSLLKQISSMRKITLGSNGELWRQKVEEEIHLTKLVLAQVILMFLLSGAYAVGQLVLTLNLARDQTVCMWSILIDLFHLGPLLYSALQFILFGCIIEKFAVIFRRMCCRCCGKD